MTYFARATELPGNAGRRATLHVEIVREADGTVVGEYGRNYSPLFKTFLPFTQRGSQYALYSPDYTATRILELPSCRDLGGEDPDPGGFCPVDYWASPDGLWGLVAGCVWGDDTSWKLQYLDLSRVPEGVLVRDDRLGYVELADELALADAVTVGENPADEHEANGGPWIAVRTTRRFQLPSGRELAPWE
jgi:hypothetical protein